jgi:hypothetical protein
MLFAICGRKGGFMRDKNRKNPDRRFSSEARSAGSDPVEPEDFLRMMEWIRQAQSDAERQVSAEETSTED